MWAGHSSASWAVFIASWCLGIGDHSGNSSGGNGGGGGNGNGNVRGHIAEMEQNAGPTKQGCTQMSNPQASGVEMHG